MTKALLLIWIGFNQTQHMSMIKFDSMDECDAAKAALLESDDAPNRGIHCIPYTFEPR